MNRKHHLIGFTDRILVTGVSGFIGCYVLRQLLERGYREVHCLCRPSSRMERIQSITAQFGQDAEVKIVRGDLLRREDCREAVRGAKLVYHLAAGTGTKSFPESYANSVVSTRNLLEAIDREPDMRRLVNVSSFVVYTNNEQQRRRVLDESAPTETDHQGRGDAYCYAKTKQEEIVVEYHRRSGIPYVNLRPGVVYGPGRAGLPGRIGLGTFGVFLHLGGSNKIPLSYVENCASAIVLAGLRVGIDDETFNVVDDELPTSRGLLRMYKQHVHRFPSIYVPKAVSRTLFNAWGGYARWSQDQIPPVYNNKAWHAFWKGSEYSNAKLKAKLGWAPHVSTAEGLTRFFESCRNARS